ncbi:hypothetical protein MUN78_04390 [Leucobacter allii]|uniref:Uncharacterized protein n=1 Tax=Leucobacter allii TaxID=2932247 RepID=A0ABY4FP84_9MICO|nr:hypothetical protein [Leucobacter allii]UOQ58090.1 hypothetical protein MUN78_04390 [Leucobacter allii]
MTVYTYSGTLADFGAAPFPTAKPRLWVSPLQDAFGPDGGVHAARQVPIPVSTGGSFDVALVASADLTPPTRYSLRCEWLDAAGIVRGWAQWDFTAAIGGGLIADMTDQIITRVWWGTEPPPVQRTGIYWIHPTTGDVREWVE